MNARSLFHFLSLLCGLVTHPTASRAAETVPSGTRPNLLFIIFDDWGWQHAGAYGCDWVKTPNFDRIAKEGVLFKNAFTSNPKCSPCRASILTGRSTWQLEEASCHNGLFPKKFAVYPDLLEKAGYTVGLTGKGWGPGDFKTPGWERNPAGPGFDDAKINPPAKGISSKDYSGNFATFLKQRPSGKPFCFWMGFTEPHRAYEPGSGLRLGKKLEAVKVPGISPTMTPSAAIWRTMPSKSNGRPACRARPPLSGGGRRAGQHSRHRHLRPRHAFPPGQRPDL
ncbi:MAG: sulfatase-like hydrolase/transferase [Verrucomicrobiales bacterium]